MISIVTPWSGATDDLVADYFHAVRQDAEIITINNACADSTSHLLDQMHEHVSGQHVKNTSNLGFAAGNNQGYAIATGDSVVFLNSDIAAPAHWLQAVVADVRDGALYGPSLQQQLVGGRWLPYLEGWCIAATRATWEQLCVAGASNGPWDAGAYPGPYWEDNDLCLRALQANIQLVQTTWPIQHKGGRTSGPLLNHAASFERNRTTFTERVLKLLRAPDATSTYQRYLHHAMTTNDIQHHLPLLFSLARGNVVELGTRTGISTAALLAGVEARGGHVWSVDRDDCTHLYADHPQWTFVRGDSRDPQLLEQVCDTPIQTLLVDTDHTIEQVSVELNLWSARMAPGGTICVHDPETFPGVRRAVQDFCAAKSWPVTFVLPCNGMAVIEVPT